MTNHQCPVSQAGAPDNREISEKTPFLFLWLETVVQPRPDVSPIAIGSSTRNSQGFCGFPVRQAAEKSQLDQLGTGRIIFGKLSDRFVKSKQVVVRRIDGDLDLIEVDASSIAAAFQTLSVTGPVDQKSSHGLSCSSKKMPPRIPVLNFIDVDQPNKRFVNQGRRLQGMIRSFARQFDSRQFAQLLVHQR